MAQYADQLFPGRDFLAREFARQPLEQVQPEGAPLQNEGALRQMKGLLDTVDLRGKQIVALLCRGSLQCGRSEAQGIAESQALQAAPAAQQVPGRDIRVGNA